MKEIKESYIELSLYYMAIESHTVKGNINIANMELLKVYEKKKYGKSLRELAQLPFLKSGADLGIFGKTTIQLLKKKSQQYDRVGKFKEELEEITRGEKFKEKYLKGLSEIKTDLFEMQEKQNKASIKDNINQGNVELKNQRYSILSIADKSLEKVFREFTRYKKAQTKKELFEIIYKRALSRGTKTYSMSKEQNEKFLKLNKTLYYEAIDEVIKNYGKILTELNTLK